MKLVGLELPPILNHALHECRRHFMAAAGFSLLINVLYLAPTLYMLQVYDRVVPTGGKATLFFITLGLAISLMTLSSLDMIRNRLLIRASLRLDALLAPRILQQMMSADSAAAGQAMRDFDSVRTALATPVVAAVFDAPWTPIFLLVAFMLHFWIGIMAVVSAIILVALAAMNREATQKKMEVATAAMAAAHNSQQAAAIHGSTIKALGMTTAVVDRQSITGVWRSATPSRLSSPAAGCPHRASFSACSFNRLLSALAPCWRSRVDFVGRHHRIVGAAQPRPAADREHHRGMVVARVRARCCQALVDVAAERRRTAELTPRLPSPRAICWSRKSGCAIATAERFCSGSASTPNLAKSWASSEPVAPARRRSAS